MIVRRTHRTGHPDRAFGSDAGDCVEADADADRNFTALAHAIHEACTDYLKGSLTMVF